MSESCNVSLKEISAKIAALRSFVIVSHYNPDADAYGSMCGLGLALESLGKHVCLLNESGQLPQFKFIPGVSRVTKEFPAAEWDGVIVCDCGELSRVGDSLVARVKNAKVLINIDHHSSNDNFGGLNFVSNAASSTSELIYDLLLELGAAIDGQVAKCLFAGLAADTGSFQFSCTSAKTFSVAQGLVQLGASPVEIAQALYGSVSQAALKLHCHALLSAEYWCDGKAAVIVVTEEMYAASGATSADAEGLAEKARNVAGVMVAISIRWDAGIWRVSMRSVGPALDVSLVAEKFGGGGHKPAAAFRWRRTLEELRAKLKEEISALLADIRKP